MTEELNIDIELILDKATPDYSQDAVGSGHEAMKPYTSFGS